MKTRYKQNLLETFCIITNSFTLSLGSDPQMIRSTYYDKLLRTVILFIENIFYNCFGKNVLNKQLWWYVFVICKIELILMSTLSYQFIAFIQQVLCRENDVIFLCKTTCIFLKQESKVLPYLKYPNQDPH